jgi:hypothetical protein
MGATGAGMNSDRVAFEGFDITKLKTDFDRLGLVDGRTVVWKSSATVILETTEGRFFVGTWTAQNARGLDMAKVTALTRALETMDRWRRGCSEAKERVAA